MKKLFYIKKRGFTLIELLAVIVILAIILLIIIPIVLNIMSDARKGAFESTAMGLIKTAENQYMENRLQGKSGAVDYIFANWDQFGEEELKFSGRGAQDGIIRVNENGRIETAINDNEWCARKDIDEIIVTVVSLEEDDCSIDEFGVHIVEYLADENGTIDGEDFQVLFQGEDTTPVTAEANTDYSFVIWDDGYMKNIRQDLNVGSSFKVKSMFDLTTENLEPNVTYQVNVFANPLEAGEVALSGGNGGVFEPGQNATAEVTSVTEGYEFVRWSSNYDYELSTDLTYEFTVNYNITLMAEFIIDQAHPNPPVDPEDPHDPSEPDPEDPYEPGDPIIPISPVDPVDPEDPETPQDPYDPENPNVPTYPDDEPWYPGVEDPCKGVQSIEIDNQEYALVGIGTQCWMAENLNYVGHAAGNSWCYENNSSLCNTYGRLYDWAAAMTACPEEQGAYLPTDKDFQTLEMSLGMSYSAANSLRYRDSGVVGRQLKTTNWGGNNASGFTALPGGWRFYYEPFFSAPHVGGDAPRWWDNEQGSGRDRGKFWTATDAGGYAWYRGLAKEEDGVHRWKYNKGNGYSVRCLVDIEEGIGELPDNEDITYIDNPEDYPTNATPCSINGVSFTHIIDKRDNEEYVVTAIGDQCWMAENLRYLPEVYGISEFDTWGWDGTECSDKIEIRYGIYGYDDSDLEGAKATDNYANYGVLYNFPAVTDGGICPAGWNVPHNAEFSILESHLSEEGDCGPFRDNNWNVCVTTDCPSAGAKLASEASLWTTDELVNYVDFGSSGFNAIPGGRRTPRNGDGDLGDTALFWTRSEAPSSDSRPKGWVHRLNYDIDGVARIPFNASGGASARCVKTREVEIPDPVMIYNWYDLDSIRNADVGGNYILMNDLDQNSAGYVELVAQRDKEDEFEELFGPWNGVDAGDQLQVAYAPLGEILIAQDVWDDSDVEVEIVNASEGIIEVKEDTNRRLYIKYKTAVEIPLGWRPIDFGGDFTSNGYEIKDLKINRAFEDNIGLFGFVDLKYLQGYIDYDDKFYDMAVIDVDIRGANMVGALAGWFFGDITNSHSTGNVVGLRSSTGGLVGSMGDGDVINSYSSCSVEGNGSVGGLVGSSGFGEIKDSHATGYVKGNGSVGGLVGSGFDITNSYATGNIDGGSSTGGLAGSFDWQWDGNTIKDSYATGTVEGTSGVGGLIGRTNYFARVENSYSTNWRVQGDFSVGGLIGATGVRTSKIIDSYSTAWVRGARHVGGLIGWADGESRSQVFLEKSYATGNVDHIFRENVSINENFGGLVGYLRQYKIIEKSYATGNVSGWEHAGGLVGYNNQAWIFESYATGDVSAMQWAGGLVGFNYAQWMDPKIENCYATGDVSGYDFVGGLVGENTNDDSWTIIRSYSIGGVNCNWADEEHCDTVGGLTGKGWYSTRCYWNTETSGMEESWGGELPRTTAEMTWPYNTEDHTGVYYTWDMDNIWTDWGHSLVEDNQGNTGYPALRWQVE